MPSCPDAAAPAAVALVAALIIVAVAVAAIAAVATSVAAATIVVTACHLCVSRALNMHPSLGAPASCERVLSMSTSAGNAESIESVDGLRVPPQHFCSSSAGVGVEERWCACVRRRWSKKSRPG